jgi:hypothetical protein
MRPIWLAFAVLLGLTVAAAAQGCGPTNPNCIVPIAPPVTSNNQAAASTAFEQRTITNVSCNNSSSDVANINAALAAGGIVQLPAGTCQVGSSSLVGGSNTWLRGYGKGVTILSVASGSTAPIISFNRGATVTNDVRVSDLTINGNDQSLSAASESILIQNATNVNIDHVSIVHMPYMFGIVLQGVTYFDVVDNDVTRATAVNTQNQCVLGTQSLANSSGHISRNYCVNTGIEYDGFQTEILSNVVANWRFGGGITLGPFSGSYQNVVAGNQTYGSTGTDVNNTSPNGLEIWSFNSVVSHNTAYNNSGSGIVVGGANDSVVGNVAYDNGQNASSTTGRAGIYIQSVGSNAWQTCAYCGVSGNSVFNTNGASGPQTYGLEINANVVGASVYSNNIQAGANGFYYGPHVGVAQSLGTHGIFTPSGASYTMQAQDVNLIFNGAGTTTVTMLAPNFYPGRQIFLKTIANQSVISANSNIVPIGSSTAGTTILLATAGKWAILISDGVNWITMAAN